MAYEHLYQNTPIEKTLEYNGHSETVYFRHLTAGEQIELKRGNKGTVHEGKATFELDWGDVDARNKLMLYFSNCDANGKRVFKNRNEVDALPGPLFAKLVDLCTEALQPPEGNG